MNFLLTDYGQDWFANNPGQLPILAEFRVGDGVNYIPEPAIDTDLRGALLFSGTPGQAQLKPSGHINYLLYMDASVGDFDWGEIGLFHNGSLFALGALSTPSPKRASSGAQQGNKTTIHASIYPGSDYVVAELANSSNELNVPVWNNIDLLPPAHEAYPNLFMVPSPNNPAKSVLAFAGGGIWNLTGYERVLYSLNLVSATATQLRIAGDIDMPPDQGGLVVNIFSGPAAGIIRTITAWDPSTKNITLSSPLPWTPLPGDLILISRYSKIADQNVYQILENLSPSLEAGDINQLEDLSAFFSPLVRKDGSSVMLANLNMGSNRVINVATPLLGGDATNKSYVDAAIAGGGVGITGLIRADGSVPMAAPLAMGGFRVSGLGTATLGTDAAPLAQVTGLIATSLLPMLRADGTVPLGGNWSAANYRIRNLGAPVDPQDAANLNTVNNAVAGILSQVMRLDGSQPMTAALNAGAQRVRNVAAATQPSDAATLADVTTRVALSVPRSGVLPMLGILDMGSFRITNLATPVGPQDAVPLARLTTDLAALANTLIKRDGTTGMQAALDLAGNKIIGLADPTNATEAATKNYVDVAVTGFDTSGLVRRDGTLAMTAMLNLGNFRIINVANPVNPQDGATQASVQSEIAASRVSLVSRDGTQAMQGNLNLGTFRIINQANPVDAQDGATKSYVDTATSGFLPRNGSAPMTGALNMGTFAITGLPATAPNAGDAVSRAALDTRFTTFSATVLLRTGAQSMQGALNMSTFKVVNLGTPTADADAATKKYVDDTVTGIDSTGFLLRNGTRSLTGTMDAAGNRITGLPVTASYVGEAPSDAISTARADLRIAAYAFPRDGSAAFTSDLNMGNNRVTNVEDPVGAQDATTKNYVDTLETLALRLDGSRAMTGSLGAGGFRVRDVASPTVDTDAVNRGAMNTAITAALVPFILRDGTRAMQGNLSLGGTFKVVDLAAPTANTDAATKLYVDTLRLASVLRDGTQGMTANLNLNANRIVGLAAPVGNTDAATKAYVDAQVDSVDVSAFLPRDGSQWMLGNLNMGVRRITNLAAPTADDDAVTRLYVTNSLSGFLPRDGSLAMTAAFNAGSFRILNVATPTGGTDAANRSYVLSEIAASRTSLILRDGTQSMQANLDMASFKVTGLGVPTTATDAASKTYVDTTVSTSVAGRLPRDGSAALTGNLNAGGFLLTNVATPVSAGDAATKSYVDDGVTDALAESDRFTVVNNAGASVTLSPSDAGLRRYNRFTAVAAAVTLNVAEGYSAGMVFNLRAVGGEVTLGGTGVTINLPPDGTLVIPQGGSVTLIMVSGTEADLVGLVETI